ncbi:MAG: PIG-L family deacetylase [Actinomycetota bacterium]|nr:PIG-L family deacetylase [Actinomycetota bacterium]
MAERPLTLMAVHAHPDDEATSTGGVLARYSAEGIRTVLVTCTDGACGDGPGGVKPGEPGHDRGAIVALRRQELEASCLILGVAHLELLEYRDSGMMGWADNDAPGSFWTTPVDDAARQLAQLMEQYQPDVVVTYDPNGFYGHPDHIQAHRVTMMAAEKTGIPAKVYWPTIPRSRMGEFAQRMREAGVDMPERLDPPEAGADAEQGPPMGSDDTDIAAWVDVAAFADRKYDALAAHASQGDNIFFLRMGREIFAELMGTEVFLRAVDRTGAALPEDDLFAGLR